MCSTASQACMREHVSPHRLSQHSSGHAHTVSRGSHKWHIHHRQKILLLHIPRCIFLVEHQALRVSSSTDLRMVHRLRHLVNTAEQAHHIKILTGTTMRPPGASCFNRASGTCSTLLQPTALLPTAMLSAIHIPQLLLRLHELHRRGHARGSPSVRPTARRMSQPTIDETSSSLTTKIILSERPTGQSP